MSTEKPGRVFREKLSDVFDLPLDVTIGLPRINLVGNLQLTIENHRGILSYSREEIRVNVKRGQCRILGKKLAIEMIMKEELWIHGEIERIEFVL